MLAESTPRNGLSALSGFLHNEGAVDSRRKNPAKKNTARQLRLNQLVKQSVQWMPMYLWNQNTHLVDLSSMEARACYGRLDLASAADITVFVLVFPPETGDDQSKYVVAPWCWIPPRQPPAPGS